MILATTRSFGWSMLKITRPSRGSAPTFTVAFYEEAAEAIQDAKAHAGRPRINVQWGKHGSLLLGWEKLPIVADEDDAEKKFYPLGRQITLLDYNRGTYEKLSKEGRRLPEHPLGRGWPKKFVGSWQDFTDFSVLIDPG